VGDLVTAAPAASHPAGRGWPRSIGRCRDDHPQARRPFPPAEWTTIAVTPCPPGWGIVYDIRGIRDDDDTADYEIRPCPAILLQELRTTSVYVTAEGEVETITHVSPYDTRAVFADHEDGVLRPVDEVSNFVRALGPGESNPPKSSHPVDARTRGGRSD